MRNYLTYTDAVLNLQKYLRRIEEPKNAVPIDGIYGSDTRAAVSRFQKANDLKDTGIVDKETWDLLYIQYERMLEENDKRIYVDLFPKNPKDYATEIGEEGYFVSAIQFILNELRISYDTLPSFEANGIYDEETANAIKEIQRIHLLPITGRVDRRTWNAISDAYNRYST